MTRVGSSVRGLVYACLLAFAGAAVGDAFAATKKTREPAPAVAASKPHKQPSEQGQTPSIQRAKQNPASVATERQPEAIQKQAKPASAQHKAMTLKSPIPAVLERQPETIQKQAKPVPAQHKAMTLKSPIPAVLQLRTDLMYHGMLESPQRYDPRRNHHVGAGIPDPYNPELTHDHFQELDHNQDGSIDPVERVFGRLDMDRDFHDRRPR